MDYNNDLAIMVLSCDKYSDLWDDFFNLKERFWPDCPFKTFLATDTKEYTREGVETIHFGSIRTWSICAQNALRQIDYPYIALFLEDAFIYKTIETDIIIDDLNIFKEKSMDFMTLERDYKTPRESVNSHVWRTDKHRKWGIDTSAAIWKKDFLLKHLKKDDCSAWAFEVNLCNEALSEKGLEGNIFYDDRKPFNISPVEVVRLGKLTPDSIRFYKKLGYNIDTTKREVISEFSMFVYNLKGKLARSPYFSKPVKKIAKILGFKFFTK